MTDLPLAASSPTPPKASLSTLPLEVRAHIVSLASAQDAIHRERWKGGSIRTQAAMPLVEKHLQNAWRGRSLAALGQTCQTFNVLASKHIFKCLNGDQLADIYFLLRILPRHATHIVKVRIVASSLDLLTRALAILPLLPNLRHLLLDGDAAVTLFDGTPILGDGLKEYPHQDLDAELRCEPFRLVAARLEHVELVDFTSTMDVFFILLLSPSLRSVRIADGLDGNVDAEVTLAAHLGSLEHLHSLTMSQDKGGLVDKRGFFLTEAWSKQKWPGRINTLGLHDVVLTPAAAAFIDALAPNLQHLTLDLDLMPEDKRLIPTALKEPFPSLLTLHLLGGTFSDFKTAVPFLADPPRTSESVGPNPPLKELRLDFRWRKSPEAHATRAVVSLFPDLTLLDLSHCDRTLSPHQHLLASTEQRGVSIPVSAISDPFQGRPEVMWLRTDIWGEDGVRNEVASRHAALKRAIDFASRRVDLMHRYGDLEGMEEAFGALGELWGLKLLEDD